MTGSGPSEGLHPIARRPQILTDGEGLIQADPSGWCPRLPSYSVDWGPPSVLKWVPTEPKLMPAKTSMTWRLLFILGGLIYVGGGSQHPRGGMVDMLADPAWFPSHAVIFVGLVLLTAGWVILRRTAACSRTLDRLLLLAIAASALEVVEMALHTMAYVDLEALRAGESTPIHTTHTWFAIAVYPLFGLILIAVIWLGQREGVLGSAWISWVGILGGIFHGAAVLIVGAAGMLQAQVLFPAAAICLSLWFVLAGAWPARAPAGGAAERGTETA